MSVFVTSLNVGKIQTLLHANKEVASAFVKLPIDSAMLTETGFTPDEQADLKNHGGVNKAICVYASEHYPYWQERLGRTLPVAAFGENLTTSGLLESDVCIGDTFQLGEAVVQISQPRQPCFKLDARYSLPKLTLWVQESGLTGFYFRCMQPGLVKNKDAIIVLEKHPVRFSIAEANRIMHKDKNNVRTIQKILQIDELSISWRKTFEERLMGFTKDDEARSIG
ncbi:MAG: MOSC domain-containing protein [Trueperaceae bacterium]